MNIGIIMRLVYKASFVVLLLVPVVCFAGSGWTDYASVAELKESSHGRFIVKLKVSKNPSDCKNRETFYRAYRMPGAQYMYVKLQKAVETSKKIRVHVTGRCELNGYSEISAVKIMP